ncbi:MAG: PBP1A family penicillin-binding protein [Acidobacteria bacterium]|nr:PBP1A family penicillin-binding protein [Acidobacteriota bacterium]
MPAKNKAPGNPKPKRSWVRRMVLWGLSAMLLAGTVVFAVVYSVMARDADGFLALFALRVPKTITKVLDRNGDVIGVFAEEHRVVIPYGDIPKAFTGAIVATEDHDFWNHRGVSPRGFLRAGYNFVTSLGRRREGASTLTMQLVRTVTAKRQKRIDRKMKEIIIAQKLERAYNKKQILESYANEVYFGGGRYGIESAAQYYFGKSAPQLNIEECALLAGIVQNPAWYNPYNPDPKSRAGAKARRNHVLRRMVAEGYLKASDAQVLAERPIRLARENPGEEELAPYAVEEVRKYLYEKYGRARVLEGGLEVHTTIDSVWQDAANEAVRSGVRAADRRRGFRKDALQFVQDPDSVQLPGWRRYFVEGDGVHGVILGWKGLKASVRIGKTVLEVPDTAFSWAGGKNLPSLFPRGAAPLFIVKEADDGTPKRLELDQEPQVEGALLATDPRTGEVRAMVGGYDFKRSKFNRAWQAERQVGSTMKLFVYTTAFLQGKSPATLVEDIPTRFIDPQQFAVTDLGGGKFEYHTLHPNAKLYEPRNYERDFWGPIPIWEAIRDSRNVPAVRTLDEVGIANVVETAKKMGITSNVPPYPSMALGAADLPMKEMMRAYGTVANEGQQAPPPFLIRKILDRTGKVLESREQSPGEQVIDKQTNFQILQCLQGVVQRGTGARIASEIQWPLAGKTGTTDEHTDAWFLGFSTRIVCGVWVGLDEKKTIFKGADGAKAAVPIWIEFMKAALQGTPKEEFPVPEGLEWADIDRVTGLKATGATPASERLHLAFKPGQIPSQESDSEAIARVREARERARTQGWDERILGARQAKPAVKEGEGAKVPDPNGVP